MLRNMNILRHGLACKSGASTQSSIVRGNWTSSVVGNTGSTARDVLAAERTFLAWVCNIPFSAITKRPVPGAGKGQTCVLKLNQTLL